MYYLLIVAGIVLIILSFFGGRAFEKNSFEREKGYLNQVNYQKELLEKQIEINRRNAKKLDIFFEARNIKRVVVYGLGLYYEKFMNDISLQIFDEIYFSDRNPVASGNVEKIFSKMELLNLEFDAVVVTSVSHYLEIREELLNLGIEQEIYSYSDIVHNLNKER